ncbi:MAG: (Fe-S)-binding protein [Hyphomicrobium sp.]|nr:(Fe-S)-binding protein [Hyphomicrobium sp.]
MSLAATVTGLFWIAVATLVMGFARRARVWSQGRPADVPWSGILAVPKRYFIDLHHVVAREPFIARAHVLTAGGAVAALLLVGVNYGLALYNPNLDRAILVAGLAMFAGTLLIAWRRRSPPARLSRGSWDRLPYTLAAFAAGLAILVTVPAETASGALSALALLLVTLGAAELALGIGTGGPMKHAVAGLTHLAFHPRAERFQGIRSTALRPLDIEKREFGIAKPEDFLWPQLLSFDACVQCGKCEAACPAFAAGQPLNPKKLIQDLVAGMTGMSDADYEGSATPGIALGTHRGAPDRAIVPGLIEPTTLWSCTTCRACVEECPMLIEHVDAIVGLRRNLNLTEGEAPGKAAEALDNLRETRTQGGFDRARRYHWAADLDIPVAEPGKPFDILLIGGEGAFDARYQRSLRALVKVMQAAKLDVAILGPDETDVGDMARRLGDEATFQSLAKDLVARLGTLTFQRIVTADPHVYHSLRNEYPAMGGRYVVVHHTQLLADLVQSCRLALKADVLGTSVTYHDPCYLGRYNGEFDAPRSVLAALGMDVREMQRSGFRARCCGGGGGAPLADVPGERRIPDMRMNDVRETGARVLAVACPQCTAMLEGVTGDRPDVRDIAELVADALEATP